MKKYLILGAALLLNSQMDWAGREMDTGPAVPSRSTSTGTAANDEQDLKIFANPAQAVQKSEARDVHNGGVVKGPIEENEKQREEDLFDETSQKRVRTKK